MSRLFCFSGYKRVLTVAVSVNAFPGVIFWHTADMTNLRTLQSLSFLLALIGSLGMIVFAVRFPFSTNLHDLKLTEQRFLRLDGAQVWIRSWVLIISSIVIQWAAED
jgi:hypothetical protein